MIYSDGTTILGGDDKSGVAAILEVIQSLNEDGAAHPPLEAVISVSEEVGLRGAREAGQEPHPVAARLRPRRRRPVRRDRHQRAEPGQSRGQGPRPHRARGRGAGEGHQRDPSRERGHRRDAAGAHRRRRPRRNIGVIQGGVATNIVPDYVFIKGEARSRDDAKLAAQTAAMAAAFQDAAERNGARVEFKIKRMYTTYKLADEHPVVLAAADAIKKLGWTPTIKASGGGTDANIYAEHGIYCAILSTGMADVHTPNEHIAIEDMTNAARLLQEIVLAA